MGERSGYTTHLFILDCSPSMGELVPDPTSEIIDDENDDHPPTSDQTSGKRSKVEAQVASKLKWAKEYINRKIVALIATKRKTEHACVIAVGDGTNNSAGEGYEYIDVLFPPTTAEDSMIEKVLDVEPGKEPGDVFGALTVGLDLLAKQSVWTRPAWAYELHIVTDGVSDFGDELLESLKGKLPSVPATTTIVGFGFNDKQWEQQGGKIELNKSELKLANEANLAALRKHLKKPPPDSSNPPRSFKIASASRALLAARFPAVKITKPTNKSLLLRLGGGDEEDESVRGIEISVKIAKMTAVVASPGLKKLAVRGPGGRGENQRERESQRELQSQLLDCYNTQHQQSSQSPRSSFQAIPSRATQQPPSLFIPDVISGPLRNITKYKLLVVPSSASTPTATDPTVPPPPPAKETLIEKEKLTRAYKLGADWVPVEEEQELTGGRAGMSVAGRFETKKGLDIYSFLHASNFNRSFSMSEVYAIFPEPNSSRSQIEFSSLIQAMLHHPKGEMHVLMRLVTEDGLPPKLCIGKAIEEGEHMQEYMVLTRMPFADDYAEAVFPSLENVKSKSGKPIQQHINIPTSEQQSAMDAFVSSMDLSNLRTDDSNFSSWYTPEDSFKPAIHRMKDVIYYQMTGDVDAGDRVPEPHPELLRYFEPPKEVVRRTKEEGVLDALRSAMDVKKVPAKKVKRKNADDADHGAEDQGDIDDILYGRTSSSINNATSRPPSDSHRASQPASSRPSTSANPARPAKKPRADSFGGASAKAADFDPDKTMEDDGAGDGSGSETEDEDDDGMGGDAGGEKYAGEDPKQVFERSLSRAGAGDVVPEAIDQLEKTILKMVNLGSSSHPQALECIRYLRQQCMAYEETLRYNSFIRSLKECVLSSSSSQLRPFWTRFGREGGLGAGLIRLEEDEFRESRVSDAEAKEFLR